jgi:hypothetical protein
MDVIEAGRRGGLKRAERLSADRRSAIARKAQKASVKARRLAAKQKVRQEEQTA